MSAIHTGPIAVRLRNDGLLQYSGTSKNHAVTGWDAVEPAQNAHARIPAQRAGSTYEAVVLNTNGSPR